MGEVRVVRERSDVEGEDWQVRRVVRWAKGGAVRGRVKVSW